MDNFDELLKIRQIHQNFELYGIYLHIIMVNCMDYMCGSTVKLTQNWYLHSCLSLEFDLLQVSLWVGLWVYERGSSNLFQMTLMRHANYSSTIRQEI